MQLGYGYQSMLSWVVDLCKRMFDAGLGEDDKQKVKIAYESLCKILHPTKPARRLLELQLSQMN